MISKSLRFLERELPGFLRVHKTVLVNPDCVKNLLTPPHPKTSGAVVLDDGTRLPVSRRQWPVLVDAVWTDGTSLNQPDRSVAFISSDVTKSLLMRQLITDQWPTILLHVIDNGSLLSQLLLLAEADRPALLLLDLRQAMPSRLALLRELKETPRLRRLPVVLLLAPNASATGPGYALQANSVVVVPDDNSRFLQVMEQVCRYWLSMASLPSI